MKKAEGRNARVKNLNSRGMAEIFQRTNTNQAEGRNARKGATAGGVAEIFQRTQKTNSIFGGFPYYNMACLLTVRETKTGETTGEYTGRVNQ